MKTIEKTVKLSDLIIKNDDLLACFMEAFTAGYKVFVYAGSVNKKTETTYAHIEGPNTIGYVQSDGSYSVCFSTVHKSERSSGFGTGFCLHNHFEGVTNPTIENINESFIFAPKWARVDLSKVRKYKSMEDYINNSIGSLEYVQVIKD